MNNIELLKEDNNPLPPIKNYWFFMNYRHFCKYNYILLYNNYNYIINHTAKDIFLHKKILNLNYQKRKKNYSNKCKY